MMNESVKKSIENSKNVLEEKRKIVQRKICIKKTHTLTIIAMNCVQEQLITIKFITQKIANSKVYIVASQIIVPKKLFKPFLLKTVTVENLRRALQCHL